MMYNPLFVLLQPQKWYTFGLQFGTLWHYYLQFYQLLLSIIPYLGFVVKAKITKKAESLDGNSALFFSQKTFSGHQ